MRNLSRRYAVTLPGPVAGHGPPTVVVVHVTDAVGPGGNLVRESADGTLRVEINGEVAMVVGTPGRTIAHPCLQAARLP
ncbi:DUF6296 family protein [Kitasatospora sp. NPDC004240]